MHTVCANRIGEKKYFWRQKWNSHVSHVFSIKKNLPFVSTVKNILGFLACVQSTFYIVKNFHYTTVKFASYVTYLKCKTCHTNRTGVPSEQTDDTFLYLGFLKTWRTKQIDVLSVDMLIELYCNRSFSESTDFFTLYCTKGWLYINNSLIFFFSAMNGPIHVRVIIWALFVWFISSFQLGGRGVERRRKGAEVTQSFLFPTNKSVMQDGSSVGNILHVFVRVRQQIVRSVGTY